MGGYISTGAVRNRAIGSSELELQASVSCLTWVLGTELKACGRAASSFTNEPSLQPLLCFLRLKSEKGNFT